MNHEPGIMNRALAGLSQEPHELKAFFLVGPTATGKTAVSQWIADPTIHAIITTGGTGFYIRDQIPEALSPLFDKEVQGFGEMFRALSRDEIGMSTLQSRALAGMANNTVIFCLPGSSGACRTGWEGIIKEQLDNRTRPCNFVPHLMRENPKHDH